MSFLENVLSFFGWGEQELEAELSDAEMAVDDITLAFDSGDLPGMVGAVDEFEAIAERLGVDTSDLSDDDTEVIVQLIPDYRAETELETEIETSGKEYATDAFTEFALSLGAETESDIEAARDLFYETEYQMAAVFETVGEAIAYTEGVNEGVLEIAEGNDGLFYVYRTYKDA